MPAYAPNGRRVALITGITGQDGSYLAELLLEKGYAVHGIVRRSSSFNTGRIDHLYRDRHETGVKLFLHYGDLCDATNLISIISKIRPTEIFNLGAMSHVKVSFDMPEYTADCDGVGVLRMLDAIRACGMEKEVRFYQASTSELYGKVQEVPQSETTPFYPRSPYAGEFVFEILLVALNDSFTLTYKDIVVENIGFFGASLKIRVFVSHFVTVSLSPLPSPPLLSSSVAKQYAFWIVVNYREAYGMHLTNGILFNHESPRRGRTFVTRKVTTTVARIHEGIDQTLYLGNIDAKRDWGHARDYVEGMWMMLQHDTPDDYVLATGETHTVREFVEKAFAVVGITVRWMGKGGTVEEIGVDADDESRVLVRIDPRYFRPTEVELLLGDPTKAEKAFGWVAKTKFDNLVREMMEEDLKMVRGGYYAGSEDH